MAIHPAHGHTIAMRVPQSPAHEAHTSLRQRGDPSGGGTEISSATGHGWYALDPITPSRAAGRGRCLGWPLPVLRLLRGVGQAMRLCTSRKSPVRCQRRRGTSMPLIVACYLQQLLHLACVVLEVVGMPVLNQCHQRGHDQAKGGDGPIGGQAHFGR